jgi:hypothetical protein
MATVETMNGHRGGPVYGEFPCEECPQSFKLAGYLERHIRRVHRGEAVNIGGRVKATGGKVVCPECLKPFVRRYLAAHLRKQHGVYGGLTGHARPDRRADNLPALVEAVRSNGNGNGKGPNLHDDPSLVAKVDDDGNVWLCGKVGKWSI